MMQEVVVITEVYNHDLCKKIMNAIYNKFIVKTFYESTQIRDCKMRYSVKTDDKLTIKKRQQIDMYAQGFIACWKSFD